VTVLAGLPPEVRWVVVALGLAVLGGSWYLARRERLPDAERTAFHAVNRRSGRLYRAVWPVMQLGSLAGGLGVAAVAGLVTGELRVALAAAATVVATWLVAKVVKALAGRGRPSAYLDDAVLREQATGLGFVSGHAAVAFGLATVLFPVLDAWAEVVALVLAAGIGAARVYVGAHLPLDVVGGAAIGFAAGTAMALVFL
jgi:glycosyltransferase 2 family protein